MSDLGRLVREKIQHQTIEEARAVITQASVRKITWPAVIFDYSSLGYDEDEKRHAELRHWLSDTLGPEGLNGRWKKHFTVVFIRDEADMVLYKLRWE